MAQRKVDSILSGPSLVNMDAPLNPDLPAKRTVDYDEWFLSEVDQGLAAADCGEFADHAAVRKMIDERYPG
jgi:hypothetical protein